MGGGVGSTAFDHAQEPKRNPHASMKTQIAIESHSPSRICASGAGSPPLVTVSFNARSAMSSGARLKNLR